MTNSPDKASLRQNRQTKSGIKATRGRPLIYDEVKQKKWYTLTPSVIQVIRDRAEVLGLTESEALERLIRVIALLPPPRLVDGMDESRDMSVEKK
ncbi:MAG: hypothetical protein VKL20_07450 [Synechocystis sp.]|nr:hypothetical protein [Synechocystis sp.]